MFVAIFRLDKPLAQSRSASLIVRIVKLCMGPPALFERASLARHRTARQRQNHTPKRVTGYPGTGDRIRSEWVTGSNRTP